MSTFITFIPSSNIKISCPEPAPNGGGEGLAELLRYDHFN